MPAINSTPSIAAEIARLTRARRIGPDRWLGHCPGSAHKHGDRHESLSIRQSGDRVLLYCFTCGRGATPEIMQALGRPMASLFRPLTSAERIRGDQERRFEKIIEQRQAQAEREVAERCRVLALLEDALFEHLLVAEEPEADELGRQWHRTHDRRHEADELWERLHRRAA